MVGSLKKVMAPPLFESEEKKRAGWTLYILSFILVIGSVPLILVCLLSDQDQSAAAISLATAISLSCLILVHRGSLIVPSYLMPLTILGVITYLMWNGKGIHDISLVSYPMVLALVGLLIGGRATLVFSGLCSLSITLVWLGEVDHRVVPNWSEPSRFGDIVNISVVLVITANLIFVAMNDLQLSLKRARQNEEALRRLNADLDQRVAQRTAELQAANEHLQVLDRAKDEFVSNVSHELRTPIAGMKLYQDLIEQIPERSGEYLGRLKRETQRLEYLIEDVLQLSRLDQGRSEFTFTPVDLNTLVTEYVADRVPLAESKGLVLTLNALPCLPAVKADQRLCGQVLGILLTNALNYTPSGGRIQVSTHLRQSGGQQWAGFSVRDTGPGVLPEEKDRLFARFFRGQVGVESGAPGTGLGLAIAKEIVDRHQGEIEVGDATGGAVFSVWLPVDAARTA